MIRDKHLRTTSAIVVAMMAAFSGVMVSAQQRAAEPSPDHSIEISACSLAFAPSGKTLAAELSFWEVATGKKVGAGTLKMEDSVVEEFNFPARSTYVAYSMDGRRFASVHFDTRLIVARHGIYLWNVPEQGDIRFAKELFFSKSSDSRYRDSLHYLAFSADGTKLATRFPNDTTVVWDTVEGKELARLDDNGLALGFIHDGRTIVSVSRDSEVQHWDLATKTRSGPINNRDRDEFFFVVDAIASADGKTLALRDSFSVVLKDAITGTTLRRIDSIFPWRMALSATGEKLAVYGKEVVSVFDTATGKVIGYLNMPERHVNCLAFSPDSKQLAVGGFPLTQVWAIDRLAADSSKKAKPKPSPVTLEATLTSRQPTYSLDHDGNSPAEFARLIRKGSLPATPNIDVVMTLKNTGDKKLDLDPKIGISSYLTGKAAMNHPTSPYQTAFGGRNPKPKYISLAPGESHAVTITSLVSDLDRNSYWVLPGEYYLHVQASVEVNSEAKEGGDEPDRVVYARIQAPPVRIDVVKEKR